MNKEMKDNDNSHYKEELSEMLREIPLAFLMAITLLMAFASNWH